MVRTFVEALGVPASSWRQGRPGLRSRQHRRRRHPARARAAARLRRPRPGRPRRRASAGPPPRCAATSPPARSRAAADILGRPHRMTGTVVHGAHRGRELGYPTANLADDAAGPGARRRGLRRLAAPARTVHRRTPSAPCRPPSRSAPTRPSTAPSAPVEAYVLDRTDLDLYGEEVTVEFVEHIRPTLRFDSIEAAARGDGWRTSRRAGRSWPRSSPPEPFGRRHAGPGGSGPAVTRCAGRESDWGLVVAALGLSVARGAAGLVRDAPPGRHGIPGPAPAQHRDRAGPRGGGDPDGLPAAARPGARALPRLGRRAWCSC